MEVLQTALSWRCFHHSVGVKATIYRCPLGSLVFGGQSSTDGYILIPNQQLTAYEPYNHVLIGV